MTTVDWTARVECVLTEVLDPCSCMASTPVNIVELGLVSVIRVSEAVDVTLTLTDPMCMYFIDMADEIQRRVVQSGWTGQVRVHYDADDDWTPARIAPDARDRLDGQRERRRALLQITPYRYGTTEEV